MEKVMQKVIPAWILIIFNDICSNSIKVTSALSNSTSAPSCNSAGKVCYSDVSQRTVINTWYIWVAVFCGLLILGTISGIHMRWRYNKSRVTIVSANVPGGMVAAQPHTRQGAMRPIFIQPSAPTYPHQTSNNPMFYRPAMMPLRPPPYSSLQPPPPPYQLQDLQPLPSPQLQKAPRPVSGLTAEKEESEAMSMIRPMQPAYIMPDAYCPTVNLPYSYPPNMAPPPPLPPPPPSSMMPSVPLGPPARIGIVETRHM